MVGQLKVAKNMYLSPPKRRILDFVWYGIYHALNNLHVQSRVGTRLVGQQVIAKISNVSVVTVKAQPVP